MYTSVFKGGWSFSSAQIAALHKAMMEVCGTAVEVLSDSSRFPETWLMRYRWDKGKKDKNVLPNGDKIVHLKVGGRTSAIVPRVQKKTGKVAGDVESADEVSEDAADSQEEPTPKKTKAQPKTTKTKAKKAEATTKDEVAKEDAKPKRTRTTKRKAESEEEDADTAVREKKEEAKPVKKRQTKKSQADTKKATKSKVEDAPAEEGSRRRSGRLSGKGV